VQEIFEQFNLWSAVEIFILAVFIYRGLILIRGTRAAQILTGILIFVGAYFLSTIFPLTTLNWLMNKFYASFLIIIIILFQDDIRHFLGKIGGKSFLNHYEHPSAHQDLDTLVLSIFSLSKKNIGALIVIERHIILSRYIDIGAKIDGVISKELIMSIFHPTSPLHDGAIVIRRGRVVVASCFLPLTRDENVHLRYGTRHRAAIGISQETDAIVLVVSEETSNISFVNDGMIKSIQSTEQLKRELQTALTSSKEKDQVTAFT